MRIEGRERVAVPRERAFAALQDPVVLKACTPGLEQLDEVGPDHFEAVLEVKLPALHGRFTGSVRIAERAAPERLRLELEGKGAPGFVHGTARLRLDEDGDGSSIHYEADVQVGGQVARLGQRMLSGVAKELAGQFFEAFERAAAGGRAAPPPAPNPILAALQLLWRTLKNLLGLSARS